MSKVRAKFVVQYVKNYDDASEIHLTPVYDDNPESENGKFFKYTPSGEVSLHVVQADTAKLFIPGKEYYVDFTPSE